MRDTIITSLEEKGDLPPLPKVLLELQKLINDPDCDANDVHRLIKADLVLTGKLVTLSNTVFFGSGRDETKTLEEAIVRLGIKMVLDLCYSLEVPKTFAKNNSFNQSEFWHHSLAVGYLSRMLTNKLIDDQEVLEASFISGLMHDVGILVFDYLIPEEYEKFFRNKDLGNSDQPVEILEQASFGIDHRELGALFLRKWWKMPSIVIAAVGDHHTNYTGDGKSITLSHIVDAANRLANEHEISHPIMSQYEEAQSQGFIQKVDITESELEFFIDQTKIGLLAFDCLLDP